MIFLLYDWMCDLIVRKTLSMRMVRHSFWQIRTEIEWMNGWLFDKHDKLGWLFAKINLPFLDWIVDYFPRSQSYSWHSCDYDCHWFALNENSHQNRYHFPIPYHLRRPHRRLLPNTMKYLQFGFSQPKKKKSVITIFAHCAILLSNNYHGISCCHHVSALGLRLKAKHLPQQWNMAIRMLARHSDLIAVFRFCKCKIKKLLKQKMLTTHFAAPKLQQSRPHIYLYNCDRFWILVCTSSHIVSIPISFSSSAISA